MDVVDSSKQVQSFQQMLNVEFEELKRQVQISSEVLKNQDGQHSPYLLRHALFISSYSFFEYSLKSFAHIAASQLHLHQRRVSGFEKVYQFYFFLVNDIGLDKLKAEENWERLNVFKDIRNSIIHYNSSIGKNISSKSFEFITTDPRLLFEEPRSFKIQDDSLVLELIDVSKEFLFTLMQDYQQKYFLDS